MLAEKLEGDADLVLKSGEIVESSGSIATSSCSSETLFFDCCTNADNQDTALITSTTVEHRPVIRQ